ncbi:MAG: hypothetical protein JO157_04830 [Acetobacteraceae bacterium]|nr:hypothetical protein [Acetobacteraceae bacterium]
MSAISPGLPDPAGVERLKLRHIIEDIDRKREQLQQAIAGTRAKQQQVQIEPIKLLLQAAGIAIGLVAAGAALATFLLRGL